MPFLARPDGCRLHYELHGPEGAPPLVLLEGLGGDVPGWSRNLPTLSRRCRVVAYDFRGNGLSDGPDEPATLATFVDDTVALLDHLGIDRAHLYGQSFGGMIAQEVALTRPDRVRSLVLAATHAGGRHVAGRRQPVPKDRPWLALFSPRFAEERPEDVEAHQRMASRNRQPLHARRRQWEAMTTFDSYERLPQIRVPTLVLHGTDDRMVDVENGKILARRIPAARLVLLEGAGHVYQWEQPEATDGAVLAFLDEVERDARQGVHAQAASPATAPSRDEPGSPASRRPRRPRSRRTA